ncbi:MAG: hypothetical protein ACRDPI_05195 [Nocardioidaceae bacterium]
MRRRAETGSALIEVTWLSILLLIPLVYLLLAVFDVQRSAFGLSAASRAAARAFVLAPTVAEGRARARAAAEVALHDQGLSLSDARLVVRCRPDPRRCLSPGSTVVVDLDLGVALPLMPSALGANTPTIRVRAEHAVPYGLFRQDRS